MFSNAALQTRTKAQAAPVRIKELGETSYDLAWSLQARLQQELADRKSQKTREKASFTDYSGYLLFTSHPHVYTLGKHGHRRHLLLTNEGLKKRNAVFTETDRGGDITYHGPGQLVCYPILDLDLYFTDIGRYLRTLEEMVVRTLAEFGIRAARSEGFTGVWVGDEKICAMGIKCSKWVTMHGLALNVNTDLSYFGHIVPCGISGRGVTSMEKLLGSHVDVAEVTTRLKHHFTDLFGTSLLPYENITV